jgi:DNA oxidative demethylase
MLTGRPLDIQPGVRLWNGGLDARAQKSLVDEVLRLARGTPFYRPKMPRSGKAFSVEETNFGSLGWISDISGYRYEPRHPVTGKPWPAIPEMLLELWREATGYPANPECCLVNLYRQGAKMGLHQDRDEFAVDAPVLSVSLGDDALFRIGGLARRAPTKSIRLRSGDVVTFGGPARLAFHGIDRVWENSSQIVPEGGRVNLTLRRIARIQKDARPGG